MMRDDGAGRRGALSAPKAVPAFSDQAAPYGAHWWADQKAAGNPCGLPQAFGGRTGTGNRRSVGSAQKAVPAFSDHAAPYGAHWWVCGFDEAGRGCLAGPVCAAAAVLPPDFPVERLADSKSLSPAAREKAEALIRERALAWGIGWASEGEIDRINILQASLLAMERAFEALEGAGSSLWSAIKNTFPLEGVADGLYIPRLPIPCRAMVRADAQVPEVMAASILAKTARDALMRDYARLYPGYGYESHKGYPTRAHREAIARLGPSPIQRRSFAHQ